MPTVVASYQTADWVTSPASKDISVTVSAGEKLVIFACTETASTTLSGVSGGGITYTSRVANNDTGRTSNYVWEGTSASSQTFTLTVTKSGGTGWYGAIVVRLSNAGTLGTPGILQSSGAPQQSMATTGADSMALVFNGDWNAVTGTTTVATGFGSGVSLLAVQTANYGAYAAYYPDTNAGTADVGWSAPAGQVFNMTYIEVAHSAGGGPTPVDVSKTGTSATTGGAATWTNAANAEGAANASVATWTNATSGATGTLDLSYDFSEIPTDATLNSVTVTVRSAVGNTSRMQAPQAQVYIGGSAVSTLATLSFNTTLTDSSFSPTLTLSQVRDSTFKVRFTARKQAANAQSSTTTLDSITVVANYTPAAGTNHTSSPADALGITDSVSVTKNVQVAISDSAGATDNAGSQATGTTNKSQDDALGVTDAASVVQANTRSQSDALGVTDSVNANLAAGGGGGGENLRVLAQFASGSTGTSHTITLSQSPTLNSLFVVAASSGILSVTGDNANWIEVLSQTSGIDIKIWRLPAANYGGNKTSVTITSASNISVAAVVFEAEIDVAGDNYFNLPNTSNGGVGTAWGTGLHTYSGSTDSFALYVGQKSVGSGGLGTMDLTSYDQSFTDFGDSGKAAGGSFDDVRVWIAHNELASMSNNGVTATINQTTVASSGSRSGMFALDLLPVAGGPSKSVSDPIGISDSVAVVQSKVVSVSDGLGLTDETTVQGTGVVSKSQSDALGITDSVDANLVTGGGATGDGFNVLASYASPSAATSHTINLSATPERNSLFVFAASAGVMSITGANWVQVFTTTDALDWKIWRLDDENFGGLTSVTITSGSAVAVTAFVWEDEADLASITNYWNPPFNTGPANGATAYGTGLHTFGTVTRAFATWVLTNGSDNDVTAYDQGFVEVADTGYAPGGAFSALQMFVASNTITSLSNSGVVATLGVPYDHTSGGRAGMFAYKALPVSASGGNKTVPDSLGITDSVATVKNVNVSISDNLTLTDAPDVAVPGLTSKTQSDTVGITDEVDANLQTGGGSGNNIRKLASYASPAASTSHTITLDFAPTLNSLFVVADSAGIMNISGDNANWIQVSSRLWDLDQKIWRLNKANFGANKTTVTITTNAVVGLTATVFEAEVDLESPNHYWDPYKSTGPSVGATAWGTALHNFSGVTHAFAFWCAQRAGDLPNYDFVSYDNGFTEFNDTGECAPGAYNSIHQWMAINEIGTFTSNGVTATFAGAPSQPTWQAGSNGDSGMFALKLLPVAGGGDMAAAPTELLNISDNVSAVISQPGNQIKTDTLGITDSLVVTQNRSITIADAVSITDNARRAGLSPTIAEENANTTGVQTRDFWHDGLSQKVDLPGFPRSTFYLPGQVAQFSVDYNSAFTFEVWRLGWYGADNTGARKVHTGSGTPTDQPAPTTIPNSNGANHCANWSVNVQWTIPDNATPGYYYVLMYNTARTQFGYMLFTVSDKYEKKPILVVSSESTWAGAYNYYGGKGAAALTGPSLYGNGGPMTGGHQARAYAVSLDRPVVTRHGIPQTHFFNGEYAFNRYLERLGVEVGYATNEQCELDPSILDGRQVIIFNGHNEYTSQTLHDKLFDLTASTQTRIINFGANDFFWRIRYGTTDGFNTTTKGRVIWCRKDTHDGPTGTGHTGGQPIVAGDWGGTWQDTRWQGGANDFAVLMGDRFTRNGVASDNIRVPFSYKTSPLWRSAPVVQALSSGQTADFGAGSAGMEWDSPIPNGEGPPRVALSEATYTVNSGVSDENGQNYNVTATITHSFQMVRTPSNSFIFNGSTTQWGWCVDNFHDRGSSIASTDARQATVNLLADFGVTIDSSKITAISGLTAPTPVGDIGTAYAVPANEGGGSFTKADTLGILDTVNVSMTRVYNITITDSVGVLDTDSPQQIGQEESVVDLLGISDTQTLVKAMNMSLTDSLGLTDTQTISKSIFRTIADTLGVTDLAQLQGAGIVSKSQADNLGISDVLTRLISMSRTFTDSLGMTDSVYAYKFVPGSTSFFYWNGSTEAPLQLKVWNGAAEVPASFEGTV